MKPLLRSAWLSIMLPLLGGCGIGLGDTVADAIFVGVSDTVATVLSTIALSAFGLSA